MSNDKYGHLVDELNLELPKLSHTVDGTSTGVQGELMPSSFTDSYASVFKTLLASSIPSICYLASLLFIVSTTLHFIGEEQMTSLYNGTALGYSTLYCISMYLIISLNMGLTAIASQAYGSGMHKLVGLYLHRNIMINLVLTTIVYIPLYFSYEILTFVGIQSDIAEVSAYFLRYSPLITFGMIFYDSFKCYLYAHDVYTPQFFIQVTLALVHWFTCQHYIGHEKLGIKGVVITMAISACLGNILMFGYVSVVNKKSHSWFCLQRESFRDIWSLFKRELPIAAMVYFEWVIFHIMVFMSSYLPPDDMAAFVTLGTLQSLLYVIPLGLSISITTLVGNSIGEKNKEKSLKMIKASMLTGVIILVFVIAIFYFNRHAIASFYNNDPAVLKSLENLLDIYIFALPADFLQCIMGGIIKGIGKEHLGSTTFLIVFYGIGLPACYVFCFMLGYGAAGLWIGMTIALYTMVGVFVVILWKTDLDEQIHHVKTRLHFDQTRSQRIYSR